MTSGAPACYRYVGYPDAETLCGRLADALLPHLGEDLSDWTFVPIPRGGLIVLGMLSYCLELERSQVAPPETSTSVVLVDDCAVSGRRFAQALDRVEAERVVFAHLCSPPALRRAIEDAEDRVERCVAASDLAVQAEPEDADQVGSIWRERLPGRRYWLGAVEPVVFAWSAPDVVFWDAEEGRIEDRWRRASPRDCLHARAEAGLPTTPLPEALDLAKGVLWRSEDDRILLWRRRDERVFGLEGTGAEAWRAILTYGLTDRAVDHLVDRYRTSPEKAARDLEELAERLQGEGLLRVEDEDATPPSSPPGAGPSSARRR